MRKKSWSLATPLQEAMREAARREARAKKEAMRQTRGKSDRIISGSRKVSSPGQLRKHAMANLGVDRMIMIENGVVTFIKRK